MEVGPLLRGFLRKMEIMAEEGVSFLLFQSCAVSQNHSGKETSKISLKEKWGGSWVQRETIS